METWVLALADNAPLAKDREATLSAWATALSQAAGVRGVEIEFWSPEEHHLSTGAATLEPPRWTTLLHVWGDVGFTPAAFETPAGITVTAFRTTECLALDFPRDWPDGAPTPGFKKTTFWRAVPGHSPVEWQAAFAHHAGLVRTHLTTVWRYRQSIIVGKPDSIPYDAISEQWWPTRASLLDRTSVSEESRKIMAADVATFLDSGCTLSIIARHVIVKTPA